MRWRAPGSFEKAIVRWSAPDLDPALCRTGQPDRHARQTRKTEQPGAATQSDANAVQRNATTHAPWDQRLLTPCLHLRRKLALVRAGHPIVVPNLVAARTTGAQMSDDSAHKTKNDTAAAVAVAAAATAAEAEAATAQASFAASSSSLSSTGPAMSQPTKRSVSFRSSPSTQTIQEFSSRDSAMDSVANSSSNASASRSFAVNQPLKEGFTLSASSSSSTASALPPSASLSSATLKPALKPSSRKLPPPEQYQHPDPLLRRLRLVDNGGSPVNLKQYFRDCKVVALYFSSQWAGMPLKEYHKTITDFQAKHPHEFKVIYVSVDVDEEWYKAGVQDKPWVSMVWNDGSSLPSERGEASEVTSAKAGFGSNLNPRSSASSSAEHSAQYSSDDGSATFDSPLIDLSSPPKLYNEEDFLLAGEVDIDSTLSLTDTAGTSYLRPYSRVHLASKLDILAAPTLAIYHVPSKKLIERNARMRRMQDGERHETWERWSRGEGSGGLSFKDALQSNKVMVFVSLVSLLYFVLVQLGGEKYNVGHASDCATTAAVGDVQLTF